MAAFTECSNIGCNVFPGGQSSNVRLDTVTIEHFCSNFNIEEAVAVVLLAAMVRWFKQFKAIVIVCYVD